jgi:ubiquitin-protein ligase
MAPAMATKRLREELIKLKTAPPPGIIAEPDESNILKWFYVIRGPSETPFEGGVYIGKLIFPSEYPMKAPSIHMLTPSGRFQINMKICMSMSDFHPESWNPMWSVATIIQGVQSFMASDELTTGGVRASEADRKKFAKFSSAYNQKNYSNLFDGDIEAALEEAHEICQKAEEETAKSISSSGDIIGPTSSSRRSRRSAKKAGSSSTEQQETNEPSEPDAENCTSNGTSSSGSNDPKSTSSRRSRRLAKMAASTEQQEQQPNHQDSEETDHNNSNHQPNKNSAAAADASIAAITKELSQAEIEKRRKRNEKKRAKQKAKKSAAATLAAEEST